MSKNNSNLRQVRVKKRKKERLGFNWFFWIALIMILIPVIYFGNLLWQANQVGHTPVIGNRITNTIINYIPESTPAQLQDQINTLEGVESAEANLIVETLRITVNVQDGMAEEEMKTLGEQIYDLVNESLPVERYFSPVDGYKQYDLEINLYDNIEKSDMILVTLLKNSAMENYSIQTLSTPVNPELAESLVNAAAASDDPETGDDSGDESTDVTDDDGEIED